MKNPEYKNHESKEEIQAVIIPYTEEHKNDLANFFDGIADEFGFDKTRRIEPNYSEKDPNSNFWIAIGEDKDVIGTVGLENRTNGIGYLSEFYVKKELRGKGIGKNLFSELLKFAQQKKYKKIFGATLPENESARKLYRELGMDVTDSPPIDISNIREGIIFLEMDLE